MNLVDVRLDIDAPAALVFELFTTEAGLCRWMAVDASVDLRVGGQWSWTHDNGDSCAGEYLVIEPPERLSFTYGWVSGPFAEVTPGSTRVDVRFEPTESGTALHLTHDGLVGELIERHDGGWRHFLGELAGRAQGDHQSAGGER